MAGSGWRPDAKSPPVALRFLPQLPGNPRSVGQEAKPLRAARRAPDPVPKETRWSPRGGELLVPERRHLPPGGRQPIHPPRGQEASRSGLGRPLPASGRDSMQGDRG